MFKTIKSKIILLTVSILLTLSIILSCFTILNFQKDKSLVIESCNLSITTLVEKINKEIVSIQNSVMSLANMGEIYFNTNRDSQILNYSVQETFENNQYSVSGGLWFEPYVIKSVDKEFFKFAYRNKNKNVVFSEETYNYLISNWYNEIKSKALQNRGVIWSTPYYESNGSETLMVTAGYGIYDKKNKLVGVSTVDWEINSIVKTVEKMRPTPNSFALFADNKNDFVIVSTYENLPSQFGDSLKDIPWYSDNLQDKQQIKYQGKNYISFVKILDNNMILIVNVPQDELFLEVTKYAFIMFAFLILMSILITITTFLILRNNVNRPIEKLTNIAEKISQGNLDTEIKLNKPKEFADLANTFDKMKKDIKDYTTNLNNVTREKERMQSELSIARTIQYSALPCDFYRNNKEFELTASMETAKEVGGDFYDFFFISPSKFMFLIADVSGKGVPAALFMMTTKTLIKSLAEQNYSPDELMNKVNERICLNNTQEFFITLFTGIIDINTGKLTCVNCGHNPPLIKRVNGDYEYLNISANLVLGAIEDMKYSTYETQFNPGDIMFMYTDGITEAINENNEFYGEENLKNCLNNNKSENLQKTLESVKSDVKKFIGEMEQYDDMTTLMFKYNGADTHKFSSQAKTENFNLFSEWLENNCNNVQIQDSQKMKLILASEEIFTNISNYAYPESTGDIEVNFTVENNEIILTFIDRGIPYNPLEKEDPNIESSVEERNVGGLGIFMVKQTMNDVKYKYQDGKNILTLKLTIL